MDEVVGGPLEREAPEKPARLPHELLVEIEVVEPVLDPIEDTDDELLQ
jgi:hypothetical protein